MKSAFTWVSFGTGAVVFALGAPAVFGGCSSSSTPPPATGGGGGEAGLSCTTDPGAYPPPNCDDTDESCTPPATACPTTPCMGTSPCLAMADNTGNATQDFRFRKLNVTAPSALAQKFVQEAVIDQGINLKDECGEGGDGTFNWLVRFDPNSKQVTTGGAPTSLDPFNTGYCFVKDTIQGLQVQPVTVNMTQAGDGSWSSDAIAKLYVPIYLAGGDAGTGVVVLPLSQAKVTGVTITGGNCIGSYNANGVTAPAADGTCQDNDDSSCQRWHTAGALGGYITLKEADGVYVQTLGKSLCVLLTGGTSTNGTHCQTDANGNVTAQGDYCSTSNSPGGCADSFWLAATFAASAVKINDGSADPSCNGSGLTTGGDGGTSSGGGTDAATE